MSKKQPTDQHPHPLTDKIISENFILNLDNDDMRAAADWQLAQVIEFLESENCSDYAGTLYYPTKGEDNSIGEALLRAMRPQQQQENKLRLVIEEWENVMDSDRTAIEVIEEFDKRLKAMRPQQQEDN